VLISRKTQRLYVRQTFESIFESPVTIADPARPIGTHVFTAIERSSGDANLRWSVVSLGDVRPAGQLSHTAGYAGAARLQQDNPVFACGIVRMDPD